MLVQMKSHVLRREEKGFVGIPLKRLLGAGMGGTLVYAMTQFLGGWSLLLAAVTALVVIFMTSARGGLPRWQRIVYGLRGRLMLSRVADPDGYLARFAEALGLPSDLVQLNGTTLFKPVAQVNRTNIQDWTIFTRPDEKGIVVAEPPSFVVQPAQEAAR